MTETIYKSKERPWLYIMVGITLLSQIGSKYQNKGMEEKIDHIGSTLTINSPKLQKLNVVGGQAIDEFYVFNKDTAFIKIDSVPVTNYNKEK